mgnify:CR=1 FL=1
MLEATNLRYTIGNNVLLTDFNLSVKPGDFVALVGPNGAGKSTALRLLGGELPPAEGTVLLDGKFLQHHPLKELARKRACFQQNPSVDYPFTVREIAALGRHPHRQGLFDQTHDETIISAALDEAGVRHLEHRLQTTLSGGEATRAHLARTLAQEPKLLLLDEPTNHLDIHYQQEILQVCDQRRHDGCAVIAVLHDLNLAARFADHIIMLNQGKTAAQGPPKEVLTAENIQAVYGIGCVVWEHPSGCPWVVPLLDSWDCPARANSAEEMPMAAHA